MNNNLMDLKSKSEEFLNGLFTYLQKQEDNRIADTVDKLRLLAEQNEKIIKQNEELINLYQLLLDKIMVMPEKTQAPQPVIESVNKIQEETVENEIMTDTSDVITPEKNNISFDENKTAFGERETSIGEHETAFGEHETTFDSHHTQVAEQESIQDIPQEEKKTSSVLEFLHKKVIKDTPQEDSGTDNSQPLSINNITEQIKERPKSIAEQFENKTKSDLRTAIGVSERFMFINDLFSGNIRDYTAFINDLSEAPTLNKSLEIINQMQSQKKWAKGSLAYSTLENMITKRFE